MGIKRKYNKNYIKKFMNVVLEENKKLIFWGLVLLLIVTIIQVLMPQIIKEFLDNAIPNNDIRLLYVLSLMYVILSLLKGGLQVVREYNISKIKNNISFKYKIKILKKLTELFGKNYEELETGKILKVINDDCTDIEQYGMDLFSDIVIDICTAIFSAFFLFNMHPILFFLLVLILFFILISQCFFTEIIGEKIKSIRLQSGELYALLTECVSNILGILISKSEKFFLKKYIEKQRKAIKDSIKLDVIFSSYNETGNVIIALITILIYSLGGFFVIKGEISLGELIIFQEYAIMFIGPCNNLIKCKSKIKQMFISLEQIYDLLDIKPIINLTEGKDKISEIKEIQFKNVSFGYGDEVILNRLNFTLERNNIYAIVGKSGCGKSTIIKLLYRLWDVDQGEIRIDNIELKDYNIEFLRNKITIVSQDLLLVNDTIRNNIIFDKKNISSDELDDICFKVGLKNFIEELPEGYNTIIGENGVKLSGGQKQRIAIARALLNESSILVFDEATSALDNITQNFVLKNIKEFFKDKIVLIISHRLAIVNDVNKIFVLEKNLIVEEGSHEELIKNRGYYYEFLKDDI